MPLFWLQKWIELSHVSQVANLWFSSHNFCGVAVIQNIYKIRKGFVWGGHVGWHAMLSHTKLFWNFLITANPQNIMTRKPQIGNMTNITKLCPFLESKKWYTRPLCENHQYGILIYFLNLKYFYSTLLPNRSICFPFALSVYYKYYFFLSFFLSFFLKANKNIKANIFWWNL